MKRRAALCLLALLSPLAIVSGSAHASSFSVSWSLPSGLYAVGIDHIRSNGTSNGGYEQFYEYPYSLYNNQPVLPSPVGISSNDTLSQVRMEFYARHPQSNYDALAGDGAVALRLSPSGNQNIGRVIFPTIGEAGAGKFTGNVLSRLPVAQGQIRIEIFQTTGQRNTSTGYLLDAFSATNSVGSRWDTGPLWNGQYIAFITDTATGREAIGLIDLNGTTERAIDLDAVCFGIDECQWTGSKQTTPGKYHGITPARLVDTRRGLGISTAIAPGDGRNTDPNGVHRLESRVNHEFVVTGRGGVPAAGVSAVMINVTAIAPSWPGSLRLIPKPPRTLVFQDQSSFAPLTEAPALHWSAGETRASTSLVRVGVGGRIRIDNASFASLNVVIDVIGWVDSSQPNQGGSRLIAVTPGRLLDTRSDTGALAGEFGSSTTKQVQVAGVKGIPSGAESVVGNLTSVNATTRTFVTAWPNGVARPETSSINVDPGAVRGNFTSVRVGSNNSISLYNNVASTHLVFDATGYHTTQSGSGGLITAVPITELTKQTMAAGQELYIQMLGRSGVPTSGVSAVYIMLTVTNPNARGFVTAYENRLGGPPLASNINWNVNQTITNLALVPLAGGAIRLYNSAPGSVVSVHLVAYVS